MKEAMLYNPLEEGKVQCSLCSHRCVISPLKKGICGVRENREGKLFSLVFGQAISMRPDPIEKKPLFHLLPGSSSFSIATVGCNFHCLQCQNHELSQMPVEEKRIDGSVVPPSEIVSLAKEYRCQSISYTYTEPTIYFEYAYETAALASHEGIRNIFVTNGYMTEEALRTIQPYLDGANVDLKSYQEKFYKEVCGAKLQPVLESLKLMKEMGIWVEITTLVIPTLNDTEREFEEIAQFILSLGAEVPWHLSAFYPTYKMLNLPRTSATALHRAREIGVKAGLRYVYCGNIPGQGGEDTFCPQCGRNVIERMGFRVVKNDVVRGECRHCHGKIEGIWQ
ncbi:MAG: AmmeMemoRadiSam system radical SAM enzyme [Deltaproteobacteria bacterium]|nr:AmmeMemoRadiSam system radical SAM enzyme [Deltaproteobacteria bacterium]MBM4324858.1 AmmeMemoRadiSam system radical SAM enzyme [Deltaproteobacteria bacterium]MBM4346600.1 AmmeMemoRadiSam system radical SAM enzyme [Deltaproteobacteria bacterium]